MREYNQTLQNITQYQADTALSKVKQSEKQKRTLERRLFSVERELEEIKRQRKMTHETIQNKHFSRHERRVAAITSLLAVMDRIQQRRALSQSKPKHFGRKERPQSVIFDLSDDKSLKQLGFMAWYKKTQQIQQHHERVARALQVFSIACLRREKSLFHYAFTKWAKFAKYGNYKDKQDKLRHECQSLRIQNTSLQAQIDRILLEHQQEKVFCLIDCFKFFGKSNTHESMPCISLLLFN